MKFTRGGQFRPLLSLSRQRERLVCGDWGISLGATVAEEFSDSRMAALLGYTQRRFSIVRLRVQIGSAGQQDAHNSQVAIRRSGQERRVAGAVTVIRVRAIGQEPGHHGGVATSHGTSNDVL